MKKQNRPKIKVIGWREWVGLPDLGIKRIKAKVDTGARTSCLHAYNIKLFKKGRRKWVSFEIHPHQRSNKGRVLVTYPFVEHRMVKSSTGHSTTRPVILTTMVIGNYKAEIEVTLVNRDLMGFRMLIGRQALRKGFVVDPSQAFLTTKVK